MNLIDKIQKKHTEVLDFYSSEKLTERERNLLRTEMAFLLELKSDAEALNIDLVSERLNSIDFAKHIEALTPVNRISVHPSPRNLGADEIYDKYKRQQERNAR